MVVTTLAGQSFSGTTDGTGNAAQFNYPIGVAPDGSGNLYVATAAITRSASDTGGRRDDHCRSGGRQWQRRRHRKRRPLRRPAGLAVDILGNIYVADTNNFTIRK